MGNTYNLVIGINNIYPIYYVKLMGNFLWRINYPLIYLSVKFYYLILILYDTLKTVLMFNRYVTDYVMGFNKRNSILLLFNPINMIITLHITISILDSSIVMWCMLIFYTLMILLYGDKIWVCVMEHYHEDDFNLFTYKYQRDKLFFIFKHGSVRATLL